MKTILIPIDFSSGSLMTCKYAILLAGDRPARIVLLHIYSDQIMIPDSGYVDGTDGDDFLNIELIDELRKSAIKNMLDFSKEVKSYLNKKNLKHIEIRHEVTGGDPYWEVHSVANNINPELIVMGTHGDGKKGFLEGSMAEHIMNKLDIPVLAVPESVDTLKVQNIMYASNYNDKDYKKIKILLDLFQHPQSKINIVHFELNNSFCHLKYFYQH
jgi:nucleotide-binding universal stress UspA family protein